MEYLLREELISCLSHFIFKTRLGGQEQSGAYFGQIIALATIRTTMSCVFLDLVRRNNYSRIDFKFLAPGHMYGPTD